MNAIVAISKNWGIGKDGSLLFHNKEDMAHFVRNTSGGTIIMGRKTLESLPNQQPLKKRRNIILTRQHNYHVPDALVCHDIMDVLELVSDQDPNDVWVIGGASIYEQLLPFCQKCIVTYHDATPDADTFFPNLNNDPSWFEDEVVPGGVTPDGITFSYHTYIHG